MDPELPNDVEPKKTRERVLEEALQAISEECPGYSDAAECGVIARRALKWPTADPDPEC